MRRQHDAMVLPHLRPAGCAWRLCAQRKHVDCLGSWPAKLKTVRSTRRFVLYISTLRLNPALSAKVSLLRRKASRRAAQACTPRYSAPVVLLRVEELERTCQEELNCF